MSTPSPLPGISFRFIRSKGIQLRVAVAGKSGPLVILAHGWPESWYSWRHQIKALADAGYQVAAPDMRGYGGSDAPPGVEDYRVDRIAEDLLGIIEAFGQEKAILVGHDWGALVAWQAVQLHPQRFSALIAMSVPYGGRPSRSPIESWKARFGDRFFYILYHQRPGEAEAEYDADPRGILSRLYQSPDAPREAPQHTDPRADTGVGWIPRLGAPRQLPDWLNSSDLDYYVSEFESAGFRGGVNYYRNFHRNWEITEHLSGKRIDIPVLFIAGEQDSVIQGASEQELTTTLRRLVNELRGVILFPGAGHWVQQELPGETNTAMLRFLADL